MTERVSEGEGEAGREGRGKGERTHPGVEGVGDHCGKGKEARNSQSQGNEWKKKKKKKKEGRRTIHRRQQHSPLLIVSLGNLVRPAKVRRLTGVRDPAFPYPLCQLLSHVEEGVRKRGRWRSGRTR